MTDILPSEVQTAGEFILAILPGKTVAEVVDGLLVDVVNVLLSDPQTTTESIFTILPCDFEGELANFHVCMLAEQNYSTQLPQSREIDMPEVSLVAESASTFSDIHGLEHSCQSRHRNIRRF